MKYVEFTVHTTSEASELIADAMWEVTSHGVTVCDSSDIVALSRDSAVFWDYMDDALAQTRNEDVLVKCYFSPKEAQEKISLLRKEIAKRQSLSGGALNFGTLEDARREIEGDDWIDVWKKHFRPIPLGKIVVVPEWIPYEKKAGEECVLLDSNMAFGTGEHETTSMCIELMQKYIKAGDVCIDVGCGSGILGISAAKLGAGFCYLTDLDPIAVESATRNAKRNGVSERVQVVNSNLLAGASVKGDLVLANITAEVLVLLAGEIGSYLKEGGTLILSGIIRERISFVKEAYERAGLTLISVHNKGEWYAFVLKGALR